MKKKEIIDIIKKVDKRKVKYNPNYNKLASSLNLSCEEELNKNKQINKTKFNFVLFKRIVSLTSVFVTGFLVCFLILTLFVKNNNTNNNNGGEDTPPLHPNLPTNGDEIIKSIFSDNGCVYMIPPIYMFEYNSLNGEVYLGIDEDKIIFFVFRFNQPVSSKISASATEGLNQYISKNILNNDSYLLIETSKEFIYEFTVSYTNQYGVITDTFLLDVTNFIPKNN